MASCHTHAATKLSSHRSHRNHRSFWRKIFSHRLHGWAQIRRVWHPAIPTQPPNHLPTEPTESTEAFGGEYSPTDCTDVHRLGGYGIPAIPTQLPNYLPTEPYAAKPSVSICEICGRLFSARSFCEFREFRGRGPRSLTICEHL